MLGKVRKYQDLLDKICTAYRKESF
uniref:Uncharacterized protein n=1 Tax=Arundo donax TaxID=35708 RepID=A0A0A8XTF0_ARUDO